VISSFNFVRASRAEHSLCTAAARCAASLLLANRFAQTIRRSKTDAADAEVLAEYTRRMPFTAWVAPSPSSMRLRSIIRHVESLSVQSAQNQNRLHAAHGSTSTPGCIVQDLKRSVASLELRIRRLRREAMTLVRQDDLLRKRYELLVSIPGIAQVSAIHSHEGSCCTQLPCDVARARTDPMPPSRRLRQNHSTP